MKVGVFDSGIGGLTVLQELLQQIPSAEYLYLGDTANVPYGTKSPIQIEKFSVQCANILRGKNIDALIVACNTASSLALPAIREEMGPIPVYGVVEPGVRAAFQAQESLSSDESLPILVLATRATVNSHAYRNALKNEQNTRLSLVQLPVVFEQACPILVPMIEEGWIDHPILEQVIQEYVGSYVKKYQRGIALLGCTHYPWILPTFQKMLPDWLIVHSGQSICDELKAQFKQEILQQSKNISVKKEVEWIFTDPDALPLFARKWITALSPGLITPSDLDF